MSDKLDELYAGYASEENESPHPDTLAWLKPRRFMPGVAKAVVTAPQQQFLRVLDTDHTNRDDRSFDEVAENRGLWKLMGLEDGASTGSEGLDTALNAGKALARGVTTLVGEGITDPYSYLAVAPKAVEMAPKVTKVVKDAYKSVPRLADETGAITIRSKDLPLAETEKLKTGEPAELPYLRNTEKAPDMGEQFGQHIEPAGRYMTELPESFSARHADERLTTGKVEFKNPLVIEWGEGYGSPQNWKAQLSAAYGGKTGKALSSAIKKDGFDGIVTVENGHTSEIVDLGAIERDLLAVHNLAPDNLQHADEMGGLIAPSVAITRKASIPNGYGEISLIGDADLIDPAYSANKVFDADVYSPRYPTVKHKIKDRELDELRKPFYQYRDDLGHFYMDDDDLAEGLEDFARRHAYDKEVQLEFLKDKGAPLTELPRQAPQFDRSFVDTDTFKKWIADGNNFDALDYDTPEYDAFSQMVGDSIDEYAKKIADAIETRGTPEWDEFYEYERNALRERNIDPDTGKVFAGAWIPLSRDIKKLKSGKMDVNMSALREKLEAEIEKAGGRKVVEDYLKERFAPALGERYMFTSGGKKKPYTAENVLKEMTRKVRSGEGFNYGLGNARSKGAKQFKTLAGIRAEKDRIVPMDQMEIVKKELDDRLMSLSSRIPAANSFRGLENLVNAIGDSYKMGMRRALRENVIDNVPDHLVDELAEFAMDLKKAPTEYFEAKIQRIVKLNEWKGAIVPENTSEETIKLLKKHGITNIQKYDKNDPASRTRAAKAFAGQLFAFGGGLIFVGANE